MRYQSTTDTISCTLHKLENLHFYLLTVFLKVFLKMQTCCWS